MPSAHEFVHSQKSATASWLHSKFCLCTTDSKPALVDSGATVHVVNDKQLLTGFIDMSLNPVRVEVADGKIVYATGIGDLLLGTAAHTYKLCALYAPSMKHNALSVSSLTSRGLIVTFDRSSACVYESAVPDAAPILIAKKCQGLYVLDLSESTERVRVLRGSPSVCVCGDKAGVCECNNAFVCCPIVGEVEGAAEPQTPAEPTEHASASEATTSIHTDSSDEGAATAKLWHDRLGHPAKSSLQYLCKHNAVTGIPSFSELECAYEHPCAECLAGRFPAASHSTLSELPTAPGQLLYADTMGPFVNSLDHSKYCVCVIDAYSGYVVATPVKFKSAEHILPAVKFSIERFEMLGHMSIVELRTDYGTEYHNAECITYLAGKGIKLSHSVPYVHQQVGMVERCNRSLQETCRSLIAHAHRKPSLWPEAMMTAAYLYNRRASTSRKQQCSRFELLTGEKPDLQHLRVWGCTALCKKPTETGLSKLESRVESGVLVGYDEYSVGYRVYIDRRVYVRSDVVFDEQKLGAWQSDVNLDEISHALVTSPTTPAASTPSVPAAHVRPVVPQAEGATRKRAYLSDNTPKSPALAVKERRRGVQPDVHTAAVHSVHTTTVHNEHIDDDASLAEKYADTYAHPPPLPKVVPGKELPIPSSYDDAISCDYAYYWKQAIESELQSLVDMGVFDVVEMPMGRHLLDSKWVFTWKVAEGTVKKAKARLVVRGFQQQEGIDYTELFSPTVSLSTIRLLLSLAASNHWYVHQLDFKTAFLNGDLAEEIYMSIPQGAEQHDGMSWRLIKSLYGLKQAPRCWYHKLKSRLGVIGFVQSSCDEALFIRHELDGSLTYVCVHVDDMLVFNGSKSVALNVVKLIKELFEIQDMGQAHEYLGFTIEHTDAGIFVHQSTYTASLVKKYMDQTHVHANTPMVPTTVLHTLGSEHSKYDDEHIVFADVHLYASCVGSLMYLANCTRPDICHATSQLAKYLSKPSVFHWKAAQHVVAYLNSTSDYGLLYSNIQPSSPCIGFCDASHCSDKDNSKSVSGFCFLHAGACIAWQSKQQSVIAQSTAESEYYAIGESGKYATHLNALFSELSSPACAIPFYVGEGEVVHASIISAVDKLTDTQHARVIYTDSEAAKKIVYDNYTTKGMRHVAKVYHWARVEVEKGRLEYKYISGKENTADLFTKCLPKDVFLKHRNTLGLVSKSSIVGQLSHA